jgi:Glycosyl hydrolases family 28
MLNTVNAAAAPTGSTLAGDFVVRVRAVDGNQFGQWLDVPTYAARVNLHNVQVSSVAMFESSGSVEVEVMPRNKAANDAANDGVVRPLSRQLAPVPVEGGGIRFRLDRPEKLSIEFGGERYRNLHLFARSIDPSPLSKDAAGVIYFGPGLHDIPGHELHIPSNSTVYLAPGAVVRGMLRCKDAKNIRICGRGLIDMSPFALEPTDHLYPYQGISIGHCQNVVVDGVTIVDSPHYGILLGESRNITIRDVSIIGYYEWGDGIDMMSCSDVLGEDLFIRTSDDCIAVYGERWRYKGDSHNVQFRNASLWADKAHPINIALHGNPKLGDELKRLRFENIDVLDHYEDYAEYQGCMAVSCGDNNRVRDVRFENVRIERISKGMLLNLRTLFNQSYSHGPGQLVENVHFENIDLAEVCPNHSVISGVEPTRPVQDVTFKNVRIAGAVVTDLAKNGIDVGPNTHRIGV